MISTQQPNKSIKWKALKPISSPTNTYQLLEPLAEGPTISTT